MNIENLTYYKDLLFEKTRTIALGILDTPFGQRMHTYYKEKMRPFLHINQRLVVGVTAILLFTAGCVFLLQWMASNIKRMQPTIPATEVSVIQPTPTVTRGWKTIQPPRSTIQFQYPEEWEYAFEYGVTESQNTLYSTRYIRFGEPNATSAAMRRQADGSSFNEFTIAYTTHPDLEDVELTEFRDDLNAAKASAARLPGWIKPRWTEVLIGNKMPAKAVEYGGCGTEECYAVFLKNGTTIYEFHMYDPKRNQQTFDLLYQILATVIIVPERKAIVDVPIWKDVPLQPQNLSPHVKVLFPEGWHIKSQQGRESYSVTATETSQSTDTLESTNTHILTFSFGTTTATYDEIYGFVAGIPEGGTKIRHPSGVARPTNKDIYTQKQTRTYNGVPTIFYVRAGSGATKVENGYYVIWEYGGMYYLASSTNENLLEQFMQKVTFLALSPSQVPN